MTEWLTDGVIVAKCWRVMRIVNSLNYIFCKILLNSILINKTILK